jgi:hypothetical protein
MDILVPPIAYIRAVLLWAFHACRASFFGTKGLPLHAILA